MWSKKVASRTGESDSVHSFLPALRDLFEYDSYRQVNEKSPKTDLGMRIMKTARLQSQFLLQGQNPQSIEMRLQGGTRITSMTDQTWPKQLAGLRFFFVMLHA